MSPQRIRRRRLVQERRYGRFAYQDFGAVNGACVSLTIVRNTAFSWLTKNKPRTVVFLNDLSAVEQQELEYEGQRRKDRDTEEIALFKPIPRKVRKPWRSAGAISRSIVFAEINQMNYRDIAEITNAPTGPSCRLSGAGSF